MRVYILSRYPQVSFLGVQGVGRMGQSKVSRWSLSITRLQSTSLLWVSRKEVQMTVINVYLFYYCLCMLMWYSLYSLLFKILVCIHTRPNTFLDRSVRSQFFDSHNIWRWLWKPRSSSIWWYAGYSMPPPVDWAIDVATTTIWWVFVILTFGILLQHNNTNINITSPITLVDGYKLIENH